MMRSLSILLFLVVPGCFVGFCRPQDTVAFNRGGTQHAGYYEEIPYEGVRNKIIVRIAIQNKERRFIWDTGAPLLVSRRLAAELYADTLAKKRITDVNAQRDSMYVVNIDGISIGATRFDGIPALVASEDNLILKCFDVEGLIGSNMTRNSIVHFDAQRQVIVLTDDIRHVAVDADFRTGLLLDSIQSLPFVEVHPAKQASERVLFDTGDGNFYSLSERSYAVFSRKRRKAFRLKERGFGNAQIGLHGEGVGGTRYRVLLPALKIGGVEFADVSTTTQDGSNTRLGAGLLRYGNVTIDGINKHFYFAPHDVTAMKLTYQKTIKDWSLSPTIPGDKLVVGIIWGNGDPGVRVGDRIMAINDVDISQRETCSLILESLLDIEENQAYLTIQADDGMTKRVKITAEE
ncbi:clan AA aspartic protease [Parapedobacter sp. ISTM3]|uniref:retropepsin-like aspartic protease n=1 Tax=Parapedobacter sp. ISTM3 TaxID=2800130 RepID=UPI0019062811|nr:retropepsin-like aspartic protease [Parapedobacter sp. ISTM3]MBK1438759.1 clan AA aspartic protease [Parapedobacter sp. ISTM3]